MKIIYIVPNVNNEGGVARVLSIKANYLIEKFNYEIHIITQNKGCSPLFYNFNDKITFHDISLEGNPLSILLSYKNQVKSLINKIKPTHIIVADNGLKAFFVPFFVHNCNNLWLEIHSSLRLQQNAKVNKIQGALIVNFKKYLANKYQKVLFETTENQLEWNSKNGIVIPNPLWFATIEKSNLQSKKVIAVARHTHEKGLDRLLYIWADVIKTHPDWHLEIYGNADNGMDLQKIVTKLKLSDNCTFYKPSKTIETKYLEAAILALTSRFEAFGMVLIEAMEAGLPCIAYDCPVGPRTIIQNDENGFLIENGNHKEYVLRLNDLIENFSLRTKMGNNAILSVKKYNIDKVMLQWHKLFNS